MTAWGHSVSHCVRWGVWFAEGYCEGRRPLTLALFFLAVQVSLASVLHSF